MKSLIAHVFKTVLVSLAIDPPPDDVPLPMLDQTPKPAAGVQRKQPAWIELLQVLEADTRANYAA